MGRPIKKEFISSGAVTGGNMLVLDEAYIPGGSAVSTNVTIVEQKGTGIYVVTDGTNTGRVQLVDGSVDLTEGFAHSKVVAVTGESGSETVYTASGISVNGAGSGYKVGDTITVPSSGTATVATASAIVAGGAITAGTATLSTDSSSTDMAGTGIAGTGGTGTGATFDVTSTSADDKFTPATITLNAAGTGYKTGDTITIPSAGTYAVTTVSTESGGAIETITATLSTTASTTDMSGTAIAGTGGSGTGATFDVTSTSTTQEIPTTTTEYASVIFNRTVSTFEGHNYDWDLNIKATAIGEADLTTVVKS